MSLYNSNNAANFREYADNAAFDVTRLTVAGWFRPISHTANGRWLCRGTGAATNEWIIGTTSGSPFNQYRFAIRDGLAALINVIDPSTFTDGVLVHLAGVYDGANAILYVNGVNVAQTAMTSDPGASATAIRTHVATGGSNQGDAEVGEIAMWNVALTAAEVASLASGRVQPLLVRPTARVIYDPCHLTTKDQILGLGTDNGTLTEVAHPPVRHKPQSRIFAPSVRDMQATINGTGTVTADLEGVGELAATINGVATVTADAEGLADLSTVINGTSTFIADGEGVADAEATIQGTASVTANLEAYGELQAFIDGSTTFSDSGGGRLDGGYGREPFGDPFGSGGPLHVLRARAIKSQVVRVVFNEEPLHQSPAGRVDALNPANYLFSAVEGEIFDAAVGTVGTMIATGVDEAVKRFPGVGFFNQGEFGVDVHVDKPLIIGMTYKVKVVNVVSRMSGILTAPNEGSFVGILKSFKIRPLRQARDLIDLKNPITLGNYVVDDSGDLAVEGGIESLRKRIFRRLTTTKGAFAFLPNYGIGLKLKELASAGELQSLKADIAQQVTREPEVQSVDVSLSLNPLGVLTVRLNVRLRAGAPLEVSMTRLADGTVLT